MWRKIFNITLLVLCASALIVMVGFVETQQHTIKCKGLFITIDYQGAEGFITATGLIREINHMQGDSLVGRRLAGVNIEQIRSKLLGNHYVQSGLVYTTIDGLIKAELRQRKPVMRVMNMKGQHFFIASDGHMMPTALDNSARVPLAHGYIREEYNTAANLKPARPLDDDIDDCITTMQKLFLMGQYLQDDSFFQALVDEIYVNPYGEFELMPKTGGHVIAFGGIEDMEAKFEKLLVFYREGLKTNGWKKYKTINIKFKNQVVCSKNNIINP